MVTCSLRDGATRSELPIPILRHDFVVCNIDCMALDSSFGDHHEKEHRRTCVRHCNPALTIQVIQENPAKQRSDQHQAAPIFA